MEILKTEVKCHAAMKRFEKCYKLLTDMKEIIKKFPNKNLVLYGETLCYLGLVKFEDQSFNEGIVSFK